MRLLSAARALVILVVVSPSATFAQSSQAVSSASVPRLINISGVFRPANGQQAAAVETVTLSIYADQEGGAPLWQETQTIALDAQGRYALLLGATRPDGIPAAVFGSGDAQWLATVFERAGEVEGPRVRITSVPYALRASDADTLGGRPASDYLVATGPAGKDGVTAGAASVEATPGASADVQPGVENFLAKYLPGGADVGSSAVYETAAGKVGIGTTAPADTLHVRFNSAGGAFTGYAVQNTALSPTAYSGMLFYDNTGALAQFQGFNNSTHEYRINNIASGGSINFMTGSTSRFVVAGNGNIGIGTTAPSALLEVSNAVPGGPANMWMTSYTNFLGPYYLARRSRGTFGAPTAVQSGDGLAGFYGEGYGTTFGPGGAGGMTVQAAQNWTATAHGTALTFITTPISSTSPATRMTLDASGNLGIGTTTVPAAGILEVSNAAHILPFAQVTATTFVNSSQGSLFVGRKARGTAAAPLAVQNGDVLAGYLALGYGTSAFSGTRGGMFIGAAETWTNAAQGTNLAFNTTLTGTTTPSTKMNITSAGDVGIGTPNPDGALEIVREGEATFIGTSYNDTDDEGSAVFLRRARGTPQTPDAVHAGDILGYFAAAGRGTTDWGNGAAAMAIIAAEPWTDTANGSTIGFATTPLGTTDFVPQAVILPNGFVGLGTPGDVNGVPTATDRLQVFGDIRVGTTGANGCIKGFGGAPLVGSCASDRRYKKDITPFGHVLNQLTALQPVHYSWRSTDFPEQHFGNSRSYGLIAQDVEQTLPELVVTNDDGFKAVDYSKLPLLTIQAVKDLKTENDALKLRVLKDLKTENDALKQRVAELERLVTEVLAAASRR